MTLGLGVRLDVDANAPAAERSPGVLGDEAILSLGRRLVLASHIAVIAHHLALVDQPPREVVRRFVELDRACPCSHNSFRASVHTAWARNP